jgi:hypothetical protein
MRQKLRGLVIAAMFGLSANSGQAADIDIMTAADLPGLYPPVDGVPCIFEDWGPTINLPWPSVWLGHFAGGRFVPAAGGPVLDWQDQKVCFPSKASCNRWISANHRAFHTPEGDRTCLPIR